MERAPENFELEEFNLKKIFEKKNGVKKKRKEENVLTKQMITSILSEAQKLKEFQSFKNKIAEIHDQPENATFFFMEIEEEKTKTSLEELIEEKNALWKTLIKKLKNESPQYFLDPRQETDILNRVDNLAHGSNLKEETKDVLDVQISF